MVEGSVTRAMVTPVRPSRNTGRPSIEFDRKPTDPPVLQRDFIDDDKGCGRVLIEDFHEQVRHPLDEGRLLFASCTLAGDLDVHVRHGFDPSGFAFDNLKHFRNDPPCAIGSHQCQDVDEVAWADRASDASHRCVFTGQIDCVDMMVNPEKPRSGASSQDMLMMVLLGGKERSSAEFTDLLTSNGFTDVKVTPTGSPLSILEFRAKV